MFQVRSARLLVWMICVVAATAVNAPIRAQDSEALSYYLLRFEFKTTSDSSTISIDSGPKRDSRLVSQSGDISFVSVERGGASIVQPIENAESGEAVSLVFDTGLGPEAFTQPIELRIEKGHLGRTSIRIHNLLPTGPVLLGEWEHDGVVPDADTVPNTVYLSLDFHEVLEGAPYQLSGPVVPKKAWAFYFPWYSDAVWDSGQNLKDTPAQPYDSHDAAAIARQIDQAQQAGIDGFIVTWQGPGSVTDQALPIILQTAEQKGFDIAIRYDALDARGEPRIQSELTQQLINLLSNYGPHPAFMKVSGRPVVFVADSTAVPIGTWATVFGLVRTASLDGFFLGETSSQNQDDLDVFDSLYTGTVTDFGNLGAFVFAVRPASTYRHLFSEKPRLVISTVTVQPGYDDELWAEPGEARIVDRQNGSTYQSVIDTVVYRGQAWILINSWNQYYENTQIEPSELYGDQYLGLTADMITQWRGPRPIIYPGGIVNSASYMHNVIAPGEIVTVFGEGIGPAEICTMQLDASGAASTTLCDTEVTFNGNPAPILYARSDTVSAVVPLSLLQANVRVQVQYQGMLTAQSSVPVYPAVPGIYTLDSTGTGQAAVRHWPDYSVNGPSNPADRGSTIMVYMTSGGPTDPPGEAGAIVSGIEELQLPVRAEIGGVPAQVGFAGSAPGLIKGALQVNIQIPENAPTGDAVPLVIWVADFHTQDGITLAVR